MIGVQLIKIPEIHFIQKLIILIKKIDFYIQYLLSGEMETLLNKIQVEIEVDNNLNIVEKGKLSYFVDKQ